MSKPYTEADLSDQVTADFTWRLREISDLKSAVLTADAQGRRVLLRALVAICYAHWEGFVRQTARKYMEHVALRRFPFSELEPQFYRNHFLPRLGGLSVSKASVQERCKLIDELLDSRGSRFSRVNDDLISTKSNLNYDVFSEICLICGVDSTSISVDQTFLDVLLLKRRNAIAHGEDTMVAIEDLGLLVDQTIGHMRSFKDAIENNTYLKRYRAA